MSIFNGESTDITSVKSRLSSVESRLGDLENSSSGGSHFLKVKSTGIEENSSSSGITFDLSGPGVVYVSGTTGFDTLIIDGVSIYKQYVDFMLTNSVISIPFKNSIYMVIHKYVGNSSYDRARAFYLLYDEE